VTRRAIPAFLAALWAIGLWGCPLAVRRDPEMYRPTAGAEAEWEDALAALDRGDLPEAVRRLRAVRDASPRFVKAHLLYQDTMIALGNEDEVRKDYESKRDRSALWLTLYARLAPDPDRIPLLEQAVEREPDLAWAHFALGFERFYREEREPARVHLRRAVELDPEMPEARVALARLHLKGGDRAGAVEQYRRYLELCPKDALRWLKLGIAVDDQEQALGAFVAVLAVTREELERAIHRRDVSLTMEQLRWYEKRCSVRYAARVSLSEILIARGNYAQAVGVLEAAVAENPECPDAHFNLGIAYEKLSRLTTGSDPAGPGRASNFAEKADYHWTRYLALGGEQRERVRAWLEDLRKHLDGTRTATRG
jgi:tetratricopeptide (TPR) repeat protein